jgi:hypothetical protein
MLVTRKNTAPGLIISALIRTHGARAADGPCVDSILAKHIEGMGGKAALEKVNSRVLKFKMESETIGASGESANE